MLIAEILFANKKNKDINKIEMQFKIKSKRNFHNNFDMKKSPLGKEALVMIIIIKLSQ